MPSIRRTATVLGTVAGLAAGLPAAATAALPDLVSEPPGPAYVEEYRDGRLLLRFDGFVTNRAGVGPLEIRASDPDPAGLMRSIRQFRDVTSPGVGGSPVPAPGGRAPTVVFEGNDDHNHFHLKAAAEYTLWTADGRAQVAVAQKTEAGFCIEDSDPSGGAYSVGTHNFCWQDRDTNGQSTLVMGISSGFRDVYTSGLSYQWIDISDVPPGRYRLGARVDPGDVLAESDEANNGYAFRDAVVPGHQAQPVTVARSTGDPVEVDLRAASFGDFGSRRYRIVTAPAHGTLDRAVGDEIAGSVVTYTPDPGWRGSDAFTYVAVDTSSRYPRTPTPAVATLAGEDVLVTVGGGPAQLVAGLGAQLTATVANGSGGVTWAVDGVRGGSPASGTITADGLYVAPSAPPPGGAVTVRATSVADPAAWAEIAIRIVGAPAVAAAPAAACVEVPARRESTGGGTVRRSAAQLLINQRISQAAVRRANAIAAWLDAGVEGRDLCGGAIGARELGPGVVSGPPDRPNDLSVASPRPLVVPPASRPSGGRVTLTGRQLLINQRVSQAAIRRLNGLRQRLASGLTGGDLAPGTVTAGTLATDVRILAADTSIARPPASRTVIAARVAPARAAALPITARQFRTNQRIAQAAVRRSNALADELAAGLTGRHIADGSVVAVNLAPALRR
ncbi:lysyl oxidase family protein [Miltoncostaea oceani]|uniref:lysyl oxidase family protein n=1 Tax=Miltoncostaea oceani TaxID=2843216 RepID=UPI001C3D9EA3|nr:lysyl oxidase family protein [Miltoncostaea oceani]